MTRTSKKKSAKSVRSSKQTAASAATTPGSMRDPDEDDEQYSITDALREADYFHGMITKTDAEAQCTNVGDFLVRKTEHVSGIIVLVITVRCSDRLRHFVVNTDDCNRLFINPKQTKKRTVPSLISWYMETRTEVISGENPTVLMNPIPRPAWSIQHDSIFIDTMLGRCNRDVHLAVCVHDGRTQVAVKVLDSELVVNRDERNKFLKEARMLRMFTHKNIVKILGVALHDSPLMIVMEYCEGGTLLAHLQEHRCKPAEKLRFITETAAGLAHIASLLCIHRDIAARHVLLTERKECKLAGFWRSEDKAILHDDTFHKVPVKWMAPESLREKIDSISSDVWSYGILVWEVYANGAEPYPDLSCREVRDMVVHTAQRMQMPEGTPEAVSKLVQSCWAKLPYDRPTMKRVLEELAHMK